MILWIARDKDGDLYLYEEEPILYTEGCFDGKNCIFLDDYAFPEITFENSPQRVEINLIDIPRKIDLL